ncbi:MAG: hypothetical protein ACOCX3_01780 [Chloroflexota bacterium]
MSVQSDVHVKMDDRVRLMSAVLAATAYPEKAQKLKPHGTHTHARATRKYVVRFDEHPAIQATRGLLDQGTPLEALFALVTLMRWPQLEIDGLPPWAPSRYNSLLWDFYQSANVAELWEKDADLWDKAHTQAEHVFTDVKLRPFFEQFVGPVEESLIFIPNISYPTDYDVGFKMGNNLFAIVPPPLAWGDSPPWPYDETTMITQTLRSAIMVYGREIIKAYLRGNLDKLDEVTRMDLPVSDQFRAEHPTWEDQFTALFLSAAVAMYLEDHVDEREFKSYMLMEKRARGMSILPGTVSVLRRFLQEKDSSDKYSTLIEFLPIFPRQLRVAQKIVQF